jgi:hypothetical protein
MNISDNHGVRDWEHVHRCPQCEHIVKADEIAHSAIVTGVITCLICDFSGPINVQIVPEDSGTS